MPGPLLESKLHVPARRHGLVARRRLTQRLDAASRSALTLLSAPAGFGKTTLLCEWLATLPADGPAAAWLSLDQRDNDPTRYWTYVIAALQKAEPGLGADALSLLAGSPPSEAVLAELLNDLSALPRDLLLVLDDYHLVDSPDIHDAMAFLLEHLPQQLHLVLATRADPALALARLRARGELVEVRAADLRFSAEEAERYLNDSMGLSLTTGDVETLDGRTEGWIAALQLAALSMQGRDDVPNFIAGFAGDDRYVVDYLAEEVLTRQPPDVRDFLLRTSVLERLTGSLCDAVTGRSDGKTMLTELERANLFLVPLDDRRQWFRYHHLFADVLQAHLADEQGSLAPELHRRASAWLAEHDLSNEAIEHSVAGQDFARAADLMELTFAELARTRQEATLRDWVQMLPDEVVRRRPVLAVAFVGALAQTSQFDTVAARLDDIEAALWPDGDRPSTATSPAQPPPGAVVVDPEGFRRLPGQVEMYRAALALSEGDVQETVRRAQLAITLTPPEGGLILAGSAALAGLALWTTGDLDGAHDGYLQAVAGLQSVGHIADVLGCSITLGDIRVTQGRLDAALRTYERALELAAAETGAPLRGTADMHVGIAGVLLERDDIAAATEHLATSRQLGDSKGLPQNPYRWRVATARLRSIEGDLDAAAELLDEAVRVYDGDYSPNVRPVPAMRARLHIVRGELAAAAAWAAERKLDPADDLSYLREYEHITLARLLLAQDRGAADLISRLLSAAESGGRTGTVIELLVLDALGQQARVHTEAALRALIRAVGLAEPQGYVRVFADEGRPMVRLLAALAKEEVAPTYVRRLQDATLGREPAAVPRSLVDPLSARELDVLRLLDSELDGPDMARHLSVSLNTLRTHTKSIYLKLGVSSRRAAVRRARELDLLPGGRHG